MKQTIKKLIAVLLAAALAVGAAQGRTAQAAPKKLTLSDFKNFTGKYKDPMNKCATTKKRKKLKKSELTYVHYIGIIGEKAPKKCIKTKRGITLLSTKKQIFKKYGKQTLIIDDFDLKHELCDYAGVGKPCFNMIKKDTWIMYLFSDKKRNNYYTLNFFINKNDKVDAIVVTRNII